MCKAIDIAKWFIKNEVSGLDDSFDGNMKINKLLYFAQLISLLKQDKVLFCDDMFAFKHGVVVENVRKEYRNNYKELRNSALKGEFKIDADDEEIMVTTKGIFGNATASELSELTHQHNVWKDLYERSKCESGYNKSMSMIDINKFSGDYSEDLDNIKEILETYNSEKSLDNPEECVEINNVKFYYDPSEISVDDDVMFQLKDFKASEKAYTIYKDINQGLVIY